MALKTQGFTLSALPRAPQVPGNIGKIDLKEIYDGVRRGLESFELARTAGPRMALADAEIAAKTAEAPLGTRGLLAQTEAAEQQLPLRTKLLADQVAVAEEQAPYRTRLLAAQSDPRMIEAKILQMRQAGIPMGAREFDMLTANLTPEQKEQARRVHLGLQARPSSAAIVYEKVVGSDGVTRLVAVDPHAVGAQVVGSGEVYGSGVATGAPTVAPASQVATPTSPTAAAVTAPSPVQNAQLFASPTIQQAATAKSEGEETAKARVEAQAKLPKVLSSLNAMDSQTVQLEQDINDAIKNVGPLTAGPAAATASVPGSPARTLRAQLESIKARLGFQELQTMRQNSPTGGAVGNVSDYEGQQLQSTIARLDQGLGPETLKKFLERVKSVRKEALSRARDAYERDAEYFGIGQPMGQAAAPVTVPSSPASAPTQFETGKEYTDAQGNRAIFRGNGQWEEVR